MKPWPILQTKTYSEFVQPEEACQLDIRLRVAWATSVVERVIGLYSPYFRQKYLQQEALEYAWAFALGAPDNEAEGDRIAQAIYDRIEEGEDEGYSRSSLMVGPYLLGEIQSGTGHGSVNAIGFASLAFAEHQVFRQGVYPDFRVIPDEYGYALGDAVYRLAREEFDFCKKNRRRPVTRSMFDGFALDMAYEPLPREILKKVRRKPPAHEREYIQSRP